MVVDRATLNIWSKYHLTYFLAKRRGRKPNTRLRLTIRAAERIFSVKTPTIFV